jgi:hypothetical protein
VAKKCQICSRGIDRRPEDRLPGRLCCSDCAAILFDAFLSIRRIRSNASSPIGGLRSSIQTLAAHAASRSGSRMDYARGLADAHNYDLALVIYAANQAQIEEKMGQP